MKPGNSLPKRETAEEFRARLVREMKAEAKRLETRAQRAQEKAEKLKKAVSAISK